MEGVQVDDKVFGVSVGNVLLWEDLQRWIIPLVGEERRDPSGGGGSVVVRELHERKQSIPVVLLVGRVHTNVLLESLIRALDLAIGRGVVDSGEVEFHVK